MYVTGEKPSLGEYASGMARLLDGDQDLGVAGPLPEAPGVGVLVELARQSGPELLKAITKQVGRRERGGEIVVDDLIDRPDEIGPTRKQQARWRAEPRPGQQVAVWLPIRVRRGLPAAEPSDQHLLDDLVWNWRVGRSLQHAARFSGACR